MSVIRLATNQPEPVKRACRDCRYYEPNVEDHGRTVTRRVGLFRTEKHRAATSDSHRFAICTAFGGRFAQTERNGQNCGPEGKMFVPAPDVTCGKVVDRGGAR